MSFISIKTNNSSREKILLQMEDFKNIQTVVIKTFGMNIFSSEDSVLKETTKVALRFSNKHFSSSKEVPVHVLRCNDTEVYRIDAKFYTYLKKNGVDQKRSSFHRNSSNSVKSSIELKSNSFLLEIFKVSSKKDNLLEFFGKCRIDADRIADSANLCKWFEITDKEGLKQVGSFYLGVLTEIQKFDLQLFIEVNDVIDEIAKYKKSSYKRKKKRMNNVFIIDSFIEYFIQKTTDKDE
ncbi:hypothetical protein MHBO_003793, partial [Bonamia ostreae]